MHESKKNIFHIVKNQNENRFPNTSSSSNEAWFLIFVLVEFLVLVKTQFFLENQVWFITFNHIIRCSLFNKIINDYYVMVCDGFCKKCVPNLSDLLYECPRAKVHFFENKTYSTNESSFISHLLFDDSRYWGIRSRLLQCP